MSNAKANIRQEATSGLIIAAVLLIFASLLLLNRQYLADQLSVWQYSPSTEVVELADRTTMSNKGRFYFYASTPVLESTTAFNEECGKKEPGSAVLGCYSGGKIYVYDVDDERLDGMSEVTAAHEMLHAAYDRLTAKDRQSVNAMIEDAYSDLKDDALVARMEMYERMQPGSRLNELHSIFGTELANLPEELEEYYSQYFENRFAITLLHQSYSTLFSQLAERSKQIESELTDLGEQIKVNSEIYNRNARILSQDIEEFNDRASSSNPDSYTELVEARSELVARTSDLETDRIAILQYIETYNLLVEELKQVSNEANSLNQSIDSSLAPPPRL